MLGVGDFYYELGVQIIEVCLALKHRNGGEEPPRPTAGRFSQHEDSFPCGNQVAWLRVAFLTRFHK